MFPQFDPSKMDPKVLMELSRMIQSLPPDMINKMQSIMHNAMAGHDVTRDMAEFEKNLPPGFREKLMGMMAGQGQAFTGFAAGGDIEIKPVSHVQETPAGSMDVHSARLTVLKAVAAGKMTPEDAERLLFA